MTRDEHGDRVAADRSPNRARPAGELPGELTIARELSEGQARKQLEHRTAERRRVGQVHWDSERLTRSREVLLELTSYSARPPRTLPKLAVPRLETVQGSVLIAPVDETHPAVGGRDHELADRGRL